MSYCFDTISRIYRDKIEPHIPDKDLAYRFGMVLEAIHEANHRVPSANGVFKGDGLNKDPDLHAAVQRLDQMVSRQRCAECGEAWPCSDSKRTDIRGEIRAKHHL